MGIHGLTGFIDNNQHLLHQYELHDCPVVLDGNNFYHFLYYACHVQCNFGGDYDVYRKKIISTFESFRLCGITPYVIMDGAYTVDGRKLKTSLSRAEARIRLVDVMANHQRGQALPALAYETFIQTMDELGVRHATCQFEADNEIAVLANKLRCSVISNDSDFYIFDLNDGFLPLDYLDFRPLEKRSSDGDTLFHYLHCHKYLVDDFINSFDGLNRSVLPVFASLLGNDFINASAFSTFYSRVKVPKIVSKKFSLPPRLSKVISVLHWLHTHCESSEFAVIKSELLEFIKPKRKERVEKMFVSSVNGYVDVENFQGVDLFHFLTSNPEEYHLTAAADFCGFNGAAFPDWFIKAACCGQITPSILNSIILHRVIILTQVEDLSQISSFVCSQHLRRILYGILLKDDRSSCRQNADKNYVEHVYDCSGSKDDILSLENPECHQLKSVFTQSSDKYILKLTETELVDKNSVLVSAEMNDVLESAEEHGMVEVDNSDFAGDEEKDIEVLSEDGSKAQFCKDQQFVNKLETVDPKKKSKESCIEEYTRLNKNLLKCLVEPLASVGKFTLPSLTDLSTMSLDQRKCMLLESFQVDLDFIDKFSEDLQLFVMCLVLWCRNATPKVTCRHLEVVIVGVLLLRLLSSLAVRKGEQNFSEKDKGEVKKRPDSLTKKTGVSKMTDKSGSATKKQTLDKNRNTLKENCEKYTPAAARAYSDERNTVNIGRMGSSLKEDNSLSEIKDRSVENIFINGASDNVRYKIDINKLCSKADIGALENIRQNLHKYHSKAPTFNHKNLYSREVSHGFAQLQSCMVDAINLNKILRFPIQNICPADLINGTFLYNFYVELSSRAAPDQFLAAMLERNSEIISVVELFKDLIVGTAGVDMAVSLTSVSKKSKKRKGKGKDKREAPEEIRADNSEEVEATIQTISGFDVTNMFSILTLED